MGSPESESLQQHSTDFSRDCQEHTQKILSDQEQLLKLSSINVGQISRYSFRDLFKPVDEPGEGQQSDYESNATKDQMFLKMRNLLPDALSVDHEDGRHDSTYANGNHA